MVRAIAFLLLASSAEGLRIAPEVQKKVALVVPLMPKSDHAWLDVFGVLGLSAKKAFEKSDWDMTLVALTSAGVDDYTRARLESFGFKVTAVPNPVPMESVRNEATRKAFKNGCCGDSEMLKLYGAKMTEYQKVIVSDADVLFLDNIDELLNNDAPMQATYDHGMDTPSSRFPPVQGGFVVITPNEKDFNEMVETAKEGDFGSAGWKGSGVGYAWGGVGPQGLWAYHYNKEAINRGITMRKGIDMAGDMSSQSPGQVVHLDRSKYNVLVTPELKKAQNEGTVAIKDVKVFHFAGECLKPWDCSHPVQSDVCDAMTARWWAERKELAANRPEDKEKTLPMGC